MIRGERQRIAIEKVYQEILADKLIDACFLKGSIARNEDDEYSDVDFYCLVNNDNLEAFLDNRLKYLQAYKSILFFENVNFICPQIVCIYEDGLHFDLYTILISQLNNYDQIKVIYDPQGLLSSYQPQNLQLQPKEVGELINEIAYTITEYYQAYIRKDNIWALQLANIIFSYYTKLIRHFVEPNKAKIGTKGFKKIRQYSGYKKYCEIMKMLQHQTSLIAVQMMVIEVDNLIMQLPVRTAEYLNIDFFLYCKNLIFKIKGV